MTRRRRRRWKEVVLSAYRDFNLKFFQIKQKKIKGWEVMEQEARDNHRKLSFKASDKIKLIFICQQPLQAQNRTKRKILDPYKKKMLSKLTAHRGIILANFYDSTRARFHLFFCIFVSQTRMARNYLLRLIF